MRIQYINIFFFLQVPLKYSIRPPFFHISNIFFSFPFQIFDVFLHSLSSLLILCLLPLSIFLISISFFLFTLLFILLTFLSLLFHLFSCLIFYKLFYSWNPLTSQIPPNFIHNSFPISSYKVYRSWKSTVLRTCYATDMIQPQSWTAALPH